MQIRLVDYQSTTAAGLDIKALRKSIDEQVSGLRENDFKHIDIPTWKGRVEGIEEIELGEWQSRNNALAALGLQQGTILERVEELKQRFSAARIGIARRFDLEPRTVGIDAGRLLGATRLHAPRLRIGAVFRRRRFDLLRRDQCRFGFDLREIGLPNLFRGRGRPREAQPDGGRLEVLERLVRGWIVDAGGDEGGLAPLFRPHRAGVPSVLRSHLGPTAKRHHVLSETHLSPIQCNP